MTDEKIPIEKKTIALNVKLAPVNHSNQPVSANYTNVTVASGIAYLDCRFIEPQALTHLAQAAQNGKTLPKGIEDHLAARVVMSLDVVQRLHQQLGQILAGFQYSKRVKQ